MNSVPVLFWDGTEDPAHGLSRECRAMRRCHTLTSSKRQAITPPPSTNTPMRRSSVCEPSSRARPYDLLTPAEVDAARRRVSFDRPAHLARGGELPGADIGLRATCGQPPFVRCRRLSAVQSAGFADYRSAECLRSRRDGLALAAVTVPPLRRDEWRVRQTDEIQLLVARERCVRRASAPPAWGAAGRPWGRSARTPSRAGRPVWMRLPRGMVEDVRASRRYVFGTGRRRCRQPSPASWQTPVT